MFGALEFGALSSLRGPKSQLFERELVAFLVRNEGDRTQATAGRVSFSALTGLEKRST